jgi:hypothetical protein
VLPKVGEREDRIARNEALFRNVNERVRELANAFAADEPDRVAFVCECGSADCAASVELTIREYEHVRAESAQFMVVPGHEIPEVEGVVEHHEHYDVVRKHAHEAQIAIDTDPRS